MGHQALLNDTEKKTCYKQPRVPLADDTMAMRFVLITLVDKIQTFFYET